MTLPTFLGIGVPKGGTTWLHELLATHPDVYVPDIVKDVRFFNRFYDMGLEWYESFFPSDGEAQDYRAIGEITVHYLYNEDCPRRITTHLERPKLIVMLRNPVDRTWSHYKHRSRLSNYQGSFEDFLGDHPEALRYSFYSEHISRYLNHVPAERFMMMLFDRVFADIPAAREQIAQFIEVDPHRFPAGAGEEIVNKGFIPRYRRIYAAINRGARIARENKLFWPVYTAKKLGLKQFISAEGKDGERLSPGDRARLLDLFDEEITALESILETDLSHWKA